MKRTERVISLVMAIVMLFSLTGCHKEIKKIDEDDLTDALEEVLDLERSDDVTEYADCYNIIAGDNPDRVVTIHGNIIDPVSGDVLIAVIYIVNEDEDDSEERFAEHYEHVINHSRLKSRDYSGYYSEGEYGYLIIEEDEAYDATYYADDMYLEVIANSKERIDEAKDFVRALGLPVR